MTNEFLPSRNESLCFCLQPTVWLKISRCRPRFHESLIIFCLVHREGAIAHLCYLLDWQFVYLSLSPVTTFRWTSATYRLVFCYSASSIFFLTPFLYHFNTHGLAFVWCGTKSFFFRWVNEILKAATIHFNFSKQFRFHQKFMPKGHFPFWSFYDGELPEIISLSCEWRRTKFLLLLPLWWFSLCVCLSRKLILLDF